MQVDADQLRDAARQLRDEVAERVRRAELQLHRPEQEFNLEAAFDTYTTAAPLRAAVGAWERELTVVAAAVRQLADALDATAADYDRADAEAAVRLEAPR